MFFSSSSAKYKLSFESLLSAIEEEVVPPTSFSKIDVFDGNLQLWQLKYLTFVPIDARSMEQK